MVFAEIQTLFLAEIRNLRVLSGQKQVISKKKKQKKVFAEIQTLFLPEIRNLRVFFGQKQVIPQNKKKRSSPETEVVFRR